MIEAEIKAILSCLSEQAEDLRQRDFAEIAEPLVHSARGGRGKELTPEDFSVLCGYDIIRKLLEQMCCVAFPETTENREYRYAILAWNTIYRTAGTLAEKYCPFGGNMDIGRWIANAYASACLNGNPIPLPENIHERKWPQPPFGSPEAWTAFCKGCARLFHGNALDLAAAIVKLEESA